MGINKSFGIEYGFSIRLHTTTLKITIQCYANDAFYSIGKIYGCGSLTKSRVEILICICVLFIRNVSTVKTFPFVLILSIVNGLCWVNYPENVLNVTSKICNDKRNRCALMITTDKTNVNIELLDGVM